jgi:hypothetical protein
VVVDVAEQQAVGGAVNDEADVAAHPHGPEVPVLRLVELVELEPGARRVHLKIERRRLRSFCSSAVRRPRLSVNVSAIRKFMAGGSKAIDHQRRA